MLTLILTLSLISSDGVRVASKSTDPKVSPEEDTERESIFVRSMSMNGECGNILSLYRNVPPPVARAHQLDARFRRLSNQHEGARAH